MEYTGVMIHSLCWLSAGALAFVVVQAPACAPARHDAGDSHAQHMRKVSASIRAVLAEPRSTDRVRVNAAGEIHVYVILTEFRPEHVVRLEALGMRVELTLPAFLLVQGWIPGGAIETVAALAFVREVKPPDYPIPRREN